MAIPTGASPGSCISTNLRSTSISAKIDPLGIEALIKLDGPILEGRFFAGSPAYTDKRMETFLDKLDYFKEQLTSKNHVSRQILWQEYKSSHLDGYGKSQFYYHLKQNLGGVPSIIVSDNLKSAVVKTDRYEPEINKAFEDMGNHYGFVVIPARSGKPKDKALVENQVKQIYHRVYTKLLNRQFYSIVELNETVQELVTKHNQTRMQQCPYT